MLYSIVRTRVESAKGSGMRPVVMRPTMKLAPEALDALLVDDAPATVRQPAAEIHALRNDCKRC